MHGISLGMAGGVEAGGGLRDDSTANRLEGVVIPARRKMADELPRDVTLRRQQPLVPLLKCRRPSDALRSVLYMEKT